MDIFEFQDIKILPDPVQRYSPTLRDSGIPLIIDNGSYQCRVGWIKEDSPMLKFKSVIAKPRKERTKKDGEIPPTPQIQVGNNITNLEAVRFQLKTQFDRNIVTHFEAQEHIFDYMFAHMGINNEGSIPHPIVITEAFLNPNYSRQLMSELLFECYGVPSIAYGVDALWGYNYGQSAKKDNSLIVSFGYYTIHIIPYINGQVIYKHSRRINTGGYHLITFLHKLLQLKYPAHSAAITLSRTEELLHGHCCVAYDYQSELVKWSNPDYYSDNIRRIQLPFTVAVPMSGLTLEQQKERKKELARRLMEMNARKREERLAEDEERLNVLLSVQEYYDDGDEDEFLKNLEANELKSFDDLQKAISNLNTRIERTKQKIVSANSNEDVIVDDSKVKIVKYEPAVNEDMQTWLQGVKRKKQDILNKRLARKQRRTDMAKRRTAAAQERMRLISQLARKEKGNDDFGLRDEDWDVYKTISREGGDSDSELENEKLLEFDEILRQHEPSSETIVTEPGEAHQLHIGIERFRAPELFFQPSMIGSIEAGLPETIGYVLKQFSIKEQQLLVDNIVLLGGCAVLPGLKERLIRELKEIRPFESKMYVYIADNPELCSWIGARNWASSPDIHEYLITRENYAELGGEYFNEHSCGNIYYPSPKAQVNTDIDI